MSLQHLSKRLLVALAIAAMSDSAAALQTPGYTEVQHAFLQEDFTAVTQLADAFLAQNPEAPESARVWLWLALSYDRLSEAHEALRELDQLKRRLPSKDPFWPEVLFWEGDISRRAFQMPRAKAAYSRLLKQHAGSSWAAQAELGMGLIELHHQAFEAAIPHFRAVSARGGETPAVQDARLFEGICQLQLKRYGKAIDALEQLLAGVQDPNVISQAAFYLGESYSGLEQFENAAAAYARAIQSTRKGSQWWRPSQFGLGWAHYRGSRCEESVEAFNAYLDGTASEHVTEALYARGSCLVKLGREAEAVDSFREIALRDPDHALALDSAFAVVDAYRRDGQFADAKKLLHDYLKHKTDPTSRAQIQLRLGAIALEQGNVLQARTVFTLATEDPDKSIRQSAYSGLGDVQLYFGNFVEAGKLYQQAADAGQETPAADRALFQRGRVHLQLNELKEAEAIFRRLADKKDSVVGDDARLALIITYMNRNEDAKACDIIMAIHQERAGTPLAVRVAYYEALLAMAQEDMEGAKRFSHGLLAKAPMTDEAFEARLLLADMQLREKSPKAALTTLRSYFTQERLPVSQRAKVAKRIGDLLRDEHRYQEAIRWYAESMELMAAMTGEATYRIASCYEEAGDFEVAVSWYQKIDQAPWQVRGQLAAAKLLEQRLDRPAQAKEIYEALAKEPIPEAKLIRERLSSWRASHN
jgi:tetratricopeptide (TPR) repeat protein